VNLEVGRPSSLWERGLVAEDGMIEGFWGGVLGRRCLSRWKRWPGRSSVEIAGGKETIHEKSSQVDWGWKTGNEKGGIKGLRGRKK